MNNGMYNTQAQQQQQQQQQHQQQQHQIQQQQQFQQQAQLHQQQQRYNIASATLPNSYHPQTLPQSSAGLAPNSYPLTNQTAPLPASPALSNSSLQFAPQISNGYNLFNPSANSSIPLNSPHLIHTSQGLPQNTTTPLANTWPNSMQPGTASQNGQPLRNNEEFNHQQIMQQTISQVITAIGLNADADRLNPSHSIRRYDPRSLPIDSRTGLRVPEASMAAIEQAYLYGNCGLNELKLYKEYLMTQRHLKTIEQTKPANDPMPVSTPATAGGSVQGTMAYRPGTPSSQFQQPMINSSNQRFSLAGNASIIPINSGLATLGTGSNGLNMNNYGGMFSQPQSSPDYLSPRHSNQRSLVPPSLPGQGVQSQSSSNPNFTSMMNSSSHPHQTSSLQPQQQQLQVQQSQLNQSTSSASSLASSVGSYNALSAPAGSSVAHVPQPQSPSHSQRFMSQLSEFLSKSAPNAHPVPFPASIEGHIIDLFKFYNVVYSAGGSQNVSRLGLWTQIAHAMELPPQNRRLSGSMVGDGGLGYTPEQIQAFQNVYGQYLFQFEGMQIMRRRQQQQQQQQAQQAQQQQQQQQHHQQQQAHQQHQTHQTQQQQHQNLHQQAQAQHQQAQAQHLHPQIPQPQAHLPSIGLASSSQSHLNWANTNQFVTSPVATMQNPTGIMSNGQIQQTYPSSSSHFVSTPTPLNHGSPLGGPGTIPNTSVPPTPTLSYAGINPGGTGSGTPAESRAGSPGSVVGGLAESLISARQSSATPVPAPSAAGNVKRPRGKKAAEKANKAGGAARGSKTGGAADKKKRLKQDHEPSSPAVLNAGLPAPLPIPPHQGDTPQDAPPSTSYTNQTPGMTSQLHMQNPAYQPPLDQNTDARSSLDFSQTSNRPVSSDRPTSKQANASDSMVQFPKQSPSGASVVPLPSQLPRIYPHNQSGIEKPDANAITSVTNQASQSYNGSHQLQSGQHIPRSMTPSVLPTSRLPNTQPHGRPSSSPLKGRPLNSLQNAEVTSNVVNKQGHHTAKKLIQYTPLARVSDNNGGWDLREIDEIFHKSAMAKPRRPLEELGLIDIHSLGMSLKSRLASEVTYALNTLTMIGPHIRLYREDAPANSGMICLPLSMCEDLLEELLDMLEEVVMARRESKNPSSSPQPSTGTSYTKVPPSDHRFEFEASGSFQVTMVNALDEATRPLGVLPGCHRLDEQEESDAESDLRPQLGQVELIFSILNVLRYFSVSEESGIYMGRNTRTAAILVDICDFNTGDLDKSKPRSSLRLTTLQRLQIRREVLQILADVGHGIQLDDHNVSIAPAILELCLFFLADAPQYIDRTPVDVTNGPHKQHHPSEVSMASQIRIRSLSIVPTHVDASLSLISKVATADANRLRLRQAISRTGTDRILSELLDVLLQLLPITDEELLLACTEEEARARVELMGMALFNIVFLQSSSTKADLRSGCRLGFLKVLMKIVSRILLSGVEDGNPAKSFQPTMQVFVERIVETIKLIEEPGELRDSLAGSNVTRVHWFGGGFEGSDEEQEIGRSLCGLVATETSEEITTAPCTPSPSPHRASQDDAEGHMTKIGQVSGEKTLRSTPERALSRRKTGLGTSTSANGRPATALSACRPALMDIFSRAGLSQNLFSTLAQLMDGPMSSR